VGIKGSRRVRLTTSQQSVSRLSRQFVNVDVGYMYRFCSSARRLSNEDNRVIDLLCQKVLRREIAGSWGVLGTSSYVRY
jgi:hypothetical protein